MNQREIVLQYEPDDQCTIHLVGEKTKLRFSGVVMALRYLHDMPDIDDAKLTVVDQQGKVTIEAFL